MVDIFIDHRQIVHYNKGEEGRMDEKDRKKVTKSNSLVEARYRLTLNEKKLILLYIAHLSLDDEEFPSIRLKVSELKKALGISNKKFPKELKETLKRLRGRVVEIPKEDGGYLITGWIASAEYIPEKGEVEILLDPKLKPYLLRLRREFTTYALKNVLKLKSTYSVRIYELLKQYEKIGKRVLSLEALKSMLKIEGEYSSYRDFRRRVLLPAYKELKEKTDISFEFREIREGRKVVAIEFYIYRKLKSLPSPKERTFHDLPDRVKEVIVDYLRSKDGIKNPIALAKTLRGFELEETAYEALRWYAGDNYELAEKLDRKKEENPQLTWTELLEYALSHKAV